MRKIVLIIVLFILIAPVVFVLTSPHRIQRVQSWIGMLSTDDYRKSNLIHPKILDSVRKKILLKDKVVIAYSNPMYKLMILNYMSDKKQKEILKKINNIIKNKKNDFKRKLDFKSSYKVISYNISKDEAKELNQLAAKTPLITKKDKNGKEIYYPVLTTILSGYNREYPKKELLSTFLGYTLKKLNYNDLTIQKGISGIEGYYDGILTSRSDSSKDIILNIDYSLQINLEKEMDEIKKEREIFESSAVILNLDDGTIEAIASSNRFNPKRITIENFNYINPTISQYLFYPKSLLHAVSDVTKYKLETVKEPKAIIYLSTLSDFGLLSSSKIDLKNERESILEEKYKIKINFMQLIRAISVFFNNGVIKDYKIARVEMKPKDKIIINKDAIDKVDIEEFIKKMKEENLILDFKNEKKSAKVDFKYFEKNDKRYLKAYFVVKNIL